MYGQIQVQIFQHDEKGLFVEDEAGVVKYRVYNLIVHFKNTELDDHLDESFKSLVPLVKAHFKLPDDYVMNGEDLTLIDTFQVQEATVDITV